MFKIPSIVIKVVTEAAKEVVKVIIKKGIKR
jgi:hypothetical protein